MAKVVGVAVPPRARERDFAEPTRIEVLMLGAEVVNAGALLHADLADALVDPRGFYNGRAFFDLQCQRLFNIDITAGIESVDGDGRVPMVRRGDQDRVAFFHLAKLAG